MNYGQVKGYVLIVFGGLVIAAGGVLLVLQWDNKAVFSLYGKNYGQNLPEAGGINTGLLMLLSAVGGLVLAAVVWLLILGIRSVRKGRRAEMERATQQRIEQIERQQQAQNNA